MKSVSHPIDRVEAMFDDPNLVTDAGLILPATLMVRLGSEGLVNQSVRLVDRVGGALPGGPALDRTARRHPPRRPADRDPHHPLPLSHAPRSDGEPQRQTRPPTSRTMAMGHNVRHRTRSAPRVADARLTRPLADRRGRRPPPRADKRTTRPNACFDAHAHRQESPATMLQALTPGQPPSNTANRPDRWIQAEAC